jgi:hypothetical protein
VWTEVFVEVVGVSFVLSLVAVPNVAGQENVKFPVSASVKTLGYSPRGWRTGKVSSISKDGMFSWC